MAQQKWQANDGSLHATQEEAEKHEAMTKDRDILSRWIDAWASLYLVQDEDAETHLSYSLIHDHPDIAALIISQLKKDEAIYEEKPLQKTYEREERNDLLKKEIR